MTQHITDITTWTAFRGEHRLASGPPADVALAVRKARDENLDGRILIFDDRTGRAVDFDPRGTDEDIAARLSPGEPTQSGAGAKRRAGRPKLGVVAKEVTLLPRHWQWLSQQPGSASATLRRLIDTARKSGSGRERVERARAAADRFMLAMLGDEPGYEEASRALYAGDQERFMKLTGGWLTDLRDHARQLARPAFENEHNPDSD